MQPRRWQAPGGDERVNGDRRRLQPPQGAMPGERGQATDAEDDVPGGSRVKERQLQRGRRADLREQPQRFIRGGEDGLQSAPEPKDGE